MNRVLRKFTTYDLVVMAVMAALGIAVKPVVVPLVHIISGPLMIPSGAFAGGLYMMWLVTGCGITRKPWTAVIISIVQALLVMLTGIVGSHGIMSLFTYVTPGLAADRFFLASGHRACCRGCCITACAIANLTGTACVNIVFFRAPGAYLVLILAIAAISGGIGGAISWGLLTALAKYKIVRTPDEGELPQRSMGRKTILIITAVIVAAGAAAGAVHFSGAGTAAAGYSLTISRSGQSDIVMSLRDIERLKAETAEAEIASSSKGNEKGSFTGVCVRDVLNSADKDILGEYRTFIFKAGDGYSAALSAKEIKNGSGIMIAYRKNGRLLEHYNDGGTGPMRLLVTTDSYGTRSVMYLVGIECRK